nr:TetR family transcriptional regulator [Paenibacillus turpanensis]
MRILLAAKKLFAQNGFGETSVRQICEEAGANLALVSYYFGGKEGLFQALFETFYPKDRVRLHEEKGLDPEAGLQLVVSEIIRFRHAEPELITILESEIARNSPRIDVIRGNVFPTWKLVRGLLEKGREQGIFHFRDTDHTLLFVLGALLFPKRWNYFSPLLEKKEPDMEDMIEDTWHFIRSGLSK